MPRVAALLLIVLLAVGGVLAVPSAQSASPDIVVSQVFAGGGNAGAPFANDYVELFNRGSSSVDVSGWTIQYASAAGSSWQATALTGSIAPGRHYLVQLASAAAVGAPLPDPGCHGHDEPRGLGRQGRRRARRDAAHLWREVPGAAPPCRRSPTSSGTALPPTTKAAVLRPQSATRRRRCAAATGAPTRTRTRRDFVAGDPAPRNSSSAAVTCGVVPPPTGGASQGATVDIDIQSALSIALERPAVSFGNATTGSTPAPVSERVTVVSNNASGYSVTVRRTAFLPADLPLGIAGTAPSGGQIGPALAGGAIAAIPIPPVADLLVGTKTAQSAPTGDVWDTRLGFAVAAPRRPGREIHGDRHLHGDRSMTRAAWLALAHARARARFGGRGHDPPAPRAHSDPGTRRARRLRLDDGSRHQPRLEPDPRRGRPRWVFARPARAPSDRAARVAGGQQRLGSG